MTLPNCGISILKQLWIRDGISASTIFSLPEEVTAGDANYIKLFLPPENYQVVNELESTNLVNTGAGAFMNVRLIRRGFVAKFDYDDANLLAAIKLIAKSHIKSATLITIYDFVSPEAEDYLDGVTIRTGIINRPIEHSGLPSTGGFSLSFVESTLRYL